MNDIYTLIGEYVLLFTQLERYLKNKCKYEILSCSDIEVKSVLHSLLSVLFVRSEVEFKSRKILMKEFQIRDNFNDLIEASNPSLKNLIRIFIEYKIDCSLLELLKSEIADYKNPKGKSKYILFERIYEHIDFRNRVVHPDGYLIKKSGELNDVAISNLVEKVNEIRYLMKMVDTY